MLLLSDWKSRRPLVVPVPRRHDDDVILGILLMLFGLPRVVLALANHEVFGAEPTMALLMVGAALAVLRRPSP